MGLVHVPAHVGVLWPMLLGSLATVAPVMFGKPLLNNVMAFDHVLLQK